MNKKLISIFAAMMICLCFVGVSYALWYKWLTIDAWIGTDKFDMQFTTVLNPDPMSVPPIIHYDPKGLDANGYVIYWPKDVGYTNVTKSADNETLYVTLVNVYPCYFNDLEIHYKNTGSVPVKIQNYTVEAVDFTPATGLDKNDGEIWFDWSNGIGSQIDPGQSGASSLLIHVEQPALQNHVYHFSIKILFVQWNDWVSNYKGTIPP